MRQRNRRWQRIVAAMMVAAWAGVLAGHPLAHLRQTVPAGAVAAHPTGEPALSGTGVAAEVCPVWQVQQLPGQARPAPVRVGATRPRPLPAVPLSAPCAGAPPRRLARAPPV